MRHDLRYAIRTLINNPGFAATAVLSLALGIGANVAIFSVLHAVILQPLPYKEADRIITIWNENEEITPRARPNGGGGLERYPYASVSLPDYLDWKEQAGSLGEFAVYELVRRYLSGTDRPRQLQGIRVSAEFFHVLGVSPLMGQPSVELDTAVLSHALWQDALGGDPDIVGKRILLDDRPHTVTAVM
ncbi:MAG: ABC transporter permease, partial [bacterium]|nr:ABC transporter permease [bacterium]